jgi:hypothetical protein
MIFLSFSADHMVELWWKFQLLKTYCSWENSILLEKCPDRFFLHQNVLQNYIENSIFFFFFRNEKPDSWENTWFIYNRWSSIECTTQIFFILTFIFFDFFLQIVQWQRNSLIYVSFVVNSCTYFSTQTEMVFLPNRNASTSRNGTQKHTHIYVSFHFCLRREIWIIYWRYVSSRAANRMVMNGNIL